MKQTGVVWVLLALTGCSSQNGAVLPNSEAAKAAAVAPPSSIKTMAPPLPSKPGK